MAIFQHFSFGPPLETMKKKLSIYAQILRGFTKSQKKHMLKISAVYLIGKAEIPIHYTTWATVEQALLKQIQKLFYCDLHVVTFSYKIRFCK